MRASYLYSRANMACGTAECSADSPLATYASCVPRHMYDLFINFNILRIDFAP